MLVLPILLLAAQPADADFEVILSRRAEHSYVADLDEIKRRGVLRVLTRNNDSSYFIARGGEFGFQYELAKGFADSLGVELRMVVSASRAGLIPELLRGEGDIIAAGMTKTPERARLVRFGTSLFTARRVVVTHRHVVKRLSRIEDLSSFTLHLVDRSTTVAMARRVGAASGVAVSIETVDPELEMQDILAGIASGTYEATIVDQDIAKLAVAAGLPVAVRLEIGGALEKPWVFRRSAEGLYRAAERHMERQRRSGRLRRTYRKYYSPQIERVQAVRDSELRTDATGKISPYDRELRQYGDANGIDWRLLAALAFTESRFDADAESPMGALGLMQVMPSTARHFLRMRGDLGKKLRSPSFSIQVGAQYLAWLMRLFRKDGVDRKQQIHFALAAYNAGIGHVIDARKLTADIGRNPDVWFGEVEEGLRLKKRRRHHSRTRYGYCRADQTIAYVRSVQARYDVYVQHVPF